MDEKEKILDGLKPLFEKARKENLWFHCSYQDLWFSPDELEEHHKNDRFVWGAVNWRLRNPQEEIDYLDKRVDDARAGLNHFVERVLRNSNP